MIHVINKWTVDEMGVDEMNESDPYIQKICKFPKKTIATRISIGVCSDRLVIWRCDLNELYNESSLKFGKTSV